MALIHQLQRGQLYLGITGWLAL